MFVPIADLLNAYDCVSAAPPGENSAYICKLTGTDHLASQDMDMDMEGLEALPEDWDDAAAYFSAPHKKELDLGASLARRFIDEVLPEKSEEVRGFFRQRGAYVRFKDLIERKDLLEAWYRYEAKATERAARMGARQRSAA